MANRYVMKACSMRRDGESMDEVRAWLEARQMYHCFADYIREEAEARAERTSPRSAPKPKPPRKAREKAVLRYRGERRNDFAGVRHQGQGNTKPEDRERTGPFQYVGHPTVRQARLAADYHRAQHAKRAAHQAEVMKHAPAPNLLGNIMAALGIGAMMRRSAARGRGQ